MMDIYELNGGQTNDVKLRDHERYEKKKLETSGVDSLFKRSRPNLEQTTGTTNIIHSFKFSSLYFEEYLRDVITHLYFKFLSYNLIALKNNNPNPKLFLHIIVIKVNKLHPKPKHN